MSKAVAHPLAQDMAIPSHWTIKAFSGKAEADKSQAESQHISIEDAQIVSALNEASNDMAFIHSCFDHITEELLIDCLIYELKAASLRHKYFLNLCKEKNIVGAVPTI